jgi:hypothetical protein
MEIFVTKAGTRERAVSIDNPEIVDRTYPATAVRLLAGANGIG